MMHSIYYTIYYTDMGHTHTLNSIKLHGLGRQRRQGAIAFCQCLQPWYLFLDPHFNNRNNE